MSSPDDPKPKGHDALLNAKTWLEKDKSILSAYRASTQRSGLVQEIEHIVEQLVELCEWQETMLRDTLAELGQEYPHE